MYYSTNIFIFIVLLLIHCIAADAAADNNTSDYELMDKDQRNELFNNTSAVFGILDLKDGPPKPPPCRCSEGQCGCCTGYILEQLNVNVRQRGCVNITYDPYEYAFSLTMRVNDRVLYENKVSARNPRPVCMPLSWNFQHALCVRLYNIHFIDRRNVYSCFSLYFKFPDAEYGAPGLSTYDCFSFGLDGFSYDPSTTQRPVHRPPETSSKPTTPSSGAPDDYDPIDEVAN